MRCESHYSIRCPTDSVPNRRKPNHTTKEIPHPLQFFFRVSTVQTYHNEFQRLQPRKRKKKEKATENAKTSQVVSSILRNYVTWQGTNVKLPDA